MIITTFRSRHSALAGNDFEGFFAELKELAKLNAGFIDIKTYRAEDGERLTIARWRDKETLELWLQKLASSPSQETGKGEMVRLLRDPNRRSVPYGYF
jgi:heme-degrading monooxygenase HmoA